jgi:DNA-binding transcriptional LysR family regulator
MKSNDQSRSPTDLDETRVDLNKLRTFAVIAARGGVSAAAGRLALSRSAVSHSLAALEDSLGMRLFHRVGRGLVLTREGELLLRAYEEAESRIGEALSTIGAEASEARGLLRVGLYPGFSRFRLSNLLQAFLGDNPEARCRLVHGSRDELTARLLSGGLDFLVSLGPGEARDRARLRSTPVFEQSLVLAARKDLRGRGRGFEAVAALPIVDYFRREPLIARWVAHHHPRQRIQARQVCAWVGAATDVALELTRRGVGACVLPADLVEPYRRSGELRVVRGSREELRDEIWLHELATPRSTALHRAFREALL